MNDKWQKSYFGKVEADTAKLKRKQTSKKAEQVVKEAEANVEAKVTARATAESKFLSRVKAEVTVKKIAKAWSWEYLVKS